MIAARRACHGTPLDLWYTPARQPEAVAICQRCPHRATCLTEALDEERDAEYRYGVRGGLTAAERDRIATTDTTGELHPLVALILAAS